MIPLKSSGCSHSRFAKHHNSNKNNRFVRFLFPLMGLVSLIWFLIRIIPKPSRAQYPCMKVAAPIASSFVLYIAGLIVTVFSFKKARQYFQNSHYVFALMLFIACISAVLFALHNQNSKSYANSAKIDTLFIPTDTANTPVGTARGIFPGRVVWKWNPDATSWDGNSGDWWSDANTNQTVVDSMLSQSLRALTGQSTNVAAWDTLFKYFNAAHGKGNIGYQAGERVTIKINLNNSYGTGIPFAAFTSPQTVLALLRQLVNNAGIPDSNITFYDLIRSVPDAIYTKCKSEFPNVHFMGFTAESGREQYVRDTTRIHWSDSLTIEKDEYGSAKGGNTVYLPTAVTKAAYLINLASFKAHRYAGVTFCAKNHFGTLSVDDDFGNPAQFAPHVAGVHAYMAVHYHSDGEYPAYTYFARPMGSYNVLVDLMGHRDLGGKTLLFMIDALYGVQSEGHSVSTSAKWKSTPFNNDWTSSLFLSQDDVALESVGLDFFRTEQAINSEYYYTYGNVDNYLHEAALANNPPSGTVYRPDGDGLHLQSLGVHEHWNNAADKQYSRNLKTGNGIELFTPIGGGSSVDEIIARPIGFVLNQNYPNPFNPTTTISYSLPIHSSVSINIFDALGRNVATLVNGEQSAGKHDIQFNAANLSSGVYFYRLQVRQISRGQSNIFTETKKLMMLK